MSWSERIYLYLERLHSKSKFKLHCFFFQESLSDLSSLNFTNNQKHYDNLAMSAYFIPRFILSTLYTVSHRNLIIV